jgi:hypothetical protein
VHRYCRSAHDVSWVVGASGRRLIPARATERTNGGVCGCAALKQDWMPIECCGPAPRSARHNEGMNDTPASPSSELDSSVVWKGVGLFAFLVFWGPFGYAVSVAFGLEGSVTLLFWTMFWGLPWSLLPVADTPYVSMHVDQLWATLCALLNLALVVGVARYAISRHERQQDKGPQDLEPTQ